MRCAPVCTAANGSSGFSRRGGESQRWCGSRGSRRSGRLIHDPVGATPLPPLPSPPRGAQHRSGFSAASPNGRAATPPRAAAGRRTGGQGNPEVHCLLCLVGRPDCLPETGVNREYREGRCSSLVVTQGKALGRANSSSCHPIRRFPARHRALARQLRDRRVTIPSFAHFSELAARSASARGRCALVVCTGSPNGRLVIQQSSRRGAAGRQSGHSRSQPGHYADCHNGEHES
jgi:hypothetical protein